MCLWLVYVHSSFCYSNEKMTIEQFYIWLIPLVIWSLIWKGLALWKSARNEQKAWYTSLLIFNTAGVLPIVYLLWFQKKSKRKK